MWDKKKGNATNWAFVEECMRPPSTYFSFSIFELADSSDIFWKKKKTLLNIQLKKKLVKTPYNYRWQNNLTNFFHFKIYKYNNTTKQNKSEL